MVQPPFPTRRAVADLAVARPAAAILAAASLAVALALMMLVAPPVVAPAHGAEMSVGERDAAGLAANTAWWGALVTGTVPALDAVLAPEFQIMRADGSSYDKQDYLASALPKVAAIPAFSHMAVTAHGDLLVVRYWVTVKETRNGETVEAHAPRLTVFRRDGDAWLVSAHANFATLEK